jgi:ABC-type antimicrobial peptide transport system permease subunit
MGLLRVFKKSVRFTFRTKRRFLVFLIIFGIVSTLIAFNIDELDKLQTDDLLDQKGIITERVEGSNITYTQANALYSDIVDKASELNIPLQSSDIYLYKELDNYLRAHTIEIEHPWANDFAKPSLIQNGRYPESIDEIMVPQGSYQNLNVTSNGQTVTIRTQLTVGQKLTLIGNNGDQIDLKIVGTFDGSKHDIVGGEDNINLWLFMDTDMFKQVIELFGYSLQDTLAYSTTYVVDGLILLPETYDKVDELNQAIKPLLTSNDALYGNWKNTAETLPIDQTKTDSRQIMVNLAFAAIGGIILSILFAYLISRFRRREIAILKAMGYGHGAVRMALYGELITIAFLGFSVGLGSAQSLLFYLSDFDNNSFIRWQAVLASFVIMVIIALPGMFLVSRRILGVSPAEAFRDK